MVLQLTSQNSQRDVPNGARVEVPTQNTADELDGIDTDFSAVPSLRLTRFLGYLEASMRGPSECEADLDVLKGVDEEAGGASQNRGNIKQRLKDWFEKQEDRYLNEQTKQKGDSQGYLDAAQLARRVFLYTAEESIEYQADLKPVLIAADFGDAEVLQLLATWGEPLVPRDSEGFTPAMLAARSCVLNALLALEGMGADFQAKTPEREDTALHVAAMSATPEIINFLVPKHLPVDIKNANGETALHLACAKGRVANVEALLALGADPRMTTNQGAEAIHVVASAGTLTVLDVLLKRVDNRLDIDAPLVTGETPLHVAAARGHTSVVSALLAYGAQKEREDNNRENAAFMAARNGHTDVLEILHAYGDDLSRGRSTLCQETPAHVAAYSGQIETIRLLYSKLEVPCGMTDAHGRSPAHYAVHGDQKQVSAMLRVLDELGVDLDQPDKEGLTPLHFAVAMGNLPAIRTLIQHSAKVTSRTTDGYTPLDYAALYNVNNAAELLCNLGVVLNDRLPRGVNTAHVAAAAGSTDVLKTFHRHHLHIDKPDDEGYQPADFAQRCDRPLTGYWLREFSASSN